MTFFQRVRIAFMFWQIDRLHKRIIKSGKFHVAKEGKR